jgi:hypothetical protein
VLSGHKIGIGLTGESRGVILQNLFSENKIAVAAMKSEATITGNSIQGAGDFGLVVQHGRVLIEANTIRDYQVAVDLTGAEATLADNSASQNRNVIQIRGGSARIATNTLYFNQGNAITVATDNREPRLGTARVRVSGNTISMQKGHAISIGSGAEAVVFGNIIESNQHGIIVLDARADISGNTIVYQQSRAVDVAGTQADVSLDHNLMAYNWVGVAIDSRAKVRLNYNNVYGNLARKEYPLEDGNYLRLDRLPTNSGDRFFISVLPAHDLKGATDLSVDPKFGDTPGEFQPAADSELARLASEGHVIGAIAPALAKK